MKSTGQKLLNLATTIKRKASYIQSFTGFDADDAEQEMNLRILERAQENPSLLDQKDAYIIQDAYYNGGRHAARSEQIYGKYVCEETYCQDDEGDEISFFEIIPDDAENPEELFVRQETYASIKELIDRLTPENRLVLAAIYFGYSESEIAEKLNVSRPAITQRKKTIAKILSPALIPA